MGTVAANTSESFLPTLTDMMTAKTSISGARTAMRISIINACWTFETSVVRRVTRDEVENLSMLAKEKSCTL